jgi:Ca2+-binding EF-hand superfamily protein
MGFTAGAELLKVIDEDGSGEISLAEIDPDSSRLWSKFRTWCAEQFVDVGVMLKSLGGKSAFQAGELSYTEFKDGLARLGWENDQPGEDEILTKALDKNNVGKIPEAQLSFLTIERKRIHRKEAARQEALKYVVRANPEDDPTNIRRARTKFKRFLKRKFGNYIRAWRSVLSPSGSMNLQKVAFLKACSSCGYNENLKLLWKAFDKDDSGSISIDELDLQSAELLAHFKNFIKARFGKSAHAFRAIDMDGSRRISYAEFAKALQTMEFAKALQAQLLFDGLDRYNRKTLVEEDLRFLDDWKPLPFLTAKENPQAAAELKEMLRQASRTYLKGWRRFLDSSMKNQCNWQEFENGCKKLGFQGDCPGAWRSLDPHLTGVITLLQIDPKTSKVFYDFRLWAEGEFGSIRSAFGVFDDDGSHEVNFKEFVKCCNVYGFDGDSHQIFRALDINRDRSLAYKEVAFLEHWVFPTSAEKKDASRRTITLAQSTLPEATEVVTDVEDGEAPASVQKEKKMTVFERLARQSFAERLKQQDEWLGPNAEKLGRQGSVKGLPLLQTKDHAAAVKTKPEAEMVPVEPMVLVTLELAEPLYSNKPYRLAHKFRPRPTTSVTLSPVSRYGNDAFGDIDGQGPGPPPASARGGGDSLSQASRDKRELPFSASASTWQSPWRKGQDQQQQQLPGHCMPTLDDLLLPAQTVDKCRPPQFRCHAGARRPLRSRGRRKAAALSSRGFTQAPVDDTQECANYACEVPLIQEGQVLPYMPAGSERSLPELLLPF